MRISGRPFQEHVRLLVPLFGVVAAVWALRLIASAAGAPLGVVRLFSVTVTSAFCILLAVLLIHKRRFGGYSSVVAAVFLLVCWEQFLIISAIAMYVLTGKTNVFTAPEHHEHMHSPMAHIAGHLTFGIGIETLFGSAMACLLFWMLRTLAPKEPLVRSGPQR
jgi:hypothetical protein